MKKLILFLTTLFFIILFFTNCKQLAVDKNGKNIYDKLEVAFNNYDKPLIDSILNTNIDLKSEYYYWHFNHFLLQSINHKDILTFNKMVEKDIFVSENNIYCDGQTLRQSLLTNENIDYLRVWLSNKSKMNTWKKDLNSILIEAVQNNNLDAVKLLLQKGASINYSTFGSENQYLSPLTAAIDASNLTIFQYLIDQKADVFPTMILWKAKDEENKKATLLHYLALSISSKPDNYNEFKGITLQMANVLINEGIDVNAVSSQNLKAIDLLGFDIFQNKITKDNIWFAEYLLQRGTILKTQSYSMSANALRFQNTQNLVLLALKGHLEWQQIDFKNTKFESTAYVKAVSGIKLRKLPSIASDELASIPYQERVSISNFVAQSDEIEGLIGNWVYVDYKGKKGFVFNAFLN
jgi:ankyrin repeat protein